MTPIEFKQLTGIEWTRILYIIKNYRSLLKPSLHQAASVKASVDTDYNLNDEDIYNICVSIENAHNLSGNIFECLCLIYFGMNGHYVEKDRTANPEYDIKVDNELIQCKWHKKGEKLNFHSANKNYSKYKQSFGIIVGSTNYTNRYIDANKNYLQLAANMARIKMTPNKIISYDITEIPSYPNNYNEDRKRILIEISKGVFGRVNIQNVFGFEFKGNMLFLTEDFINSISSKNERLDLATAAKKFVDYFDKDNYQTLKIINDKKIELKDKKKFNKMNANQKAESNLLKGKTGNIVRTTTKNIFNY